MTKLGFVFVAALAACGGKGPSTAAVPVTAATGVLTITPLKFYEGDDLGMTLAADGKLAIKSKHSEGGKPAQEEWRDVGVIGAAGTIALKGDVVGKLEADGSFLSKSGRMPMFKLDGDSLVIDGKKLTIDDKGVLQGGTEGAKIHVTGITDAGARRTALFVLAVALGGAQEAAAPDAKSGY